MNTDEQSRVVSTRPRCLSIAQARTRYSKPFFSTSRPDERIWSGSFAALCRWAGVPVRMTRYPGMIHGFFGMGSLIDRAKVAIDEAATGLRSAFGT